MSWQHQNYRFHMYISHSQTHCKHYYPRSKTDMTQLRSPKSVTTLQGDSKPEEVVKNSNKINQRIHSTTPQPARADSALQNCSYFRETFQYYQPQMFKKITSQALEK